MNARLRQMDAARAAPQHMLELPLLVGRCSSTKSFCCTTASRAAVVPRSMAGAWSDYPSPAAAGADSPAKQPCHGKLEPAYLKEAGKSAVCAADAPHGSRTLNCCCSLLRCCRVYWPTVHATTRSCSGCAGPASRGRTATTALAATPGGSSHIVPHSDTLFLIIFLVVTHHIPPSRCSTRACFAARIV